MCSAKLEISANAPPFNRDAAITRLTLFVICERSLHPLYGLRSLLPHQYSTVDCQCLMAHSCPVKCILNFVRASLADPRIFLSRSSATFRLGCPSCAVNYLLCCRRTRDLPHSSALLQSGCRPRSLSCSSPSVYTVFSNFCPNRLTAAYTRQTSFVASLSAYSVSPQIVRQGSLFALRSQFVRHSLYPCTIADQYSYFDSLFGFCGQTNSFSSSRAPDLSVRLAKLNRTESRPP